MMETENQKRRPKFVDPEQAAENLAKITIWAFKQYAKQPDDFKRDVLKIRIRWLKSAGEYAVIENILQDWLEYELDVYRGKFAAESKVFNDTVEFAREIGYNPLAEEYDQKKGAGGKPRCTRQ